MTGGTPDDIPTGYRRPDARIAGTHFYLQPQCDYEGITPLCMVMQLDGDGQRILAERCLHRDAVTIVDALRLTHSLQPRRNTKDTDVTTDQEDSRIPEHELEPDRRQPYRNGRRNARNIYQVDRTSNSHLDDEHIGCMFQPGLGLLAVHALNTVYGTEVAPMRLRDQP